VDREKCLAYAAEFTPLLERRFNVALDVRYPEEEEFLEELAAREDAREALRQHHKDRSRSSGLYYPDMNAILFYPEDMYNDCETAYTSMHELAHAVEMALREDGRAAPAGAQTLEEVLTEGFADHVSVDLMAGAYGLQETDDFLERKRAILKSQRQRYERRGLYLLQDDLGTVMPDAQLSPAKRLWLRFLLWNDDAELYDYSYSVGYALFTEAQANRISAETVLRHPPADLNEVLSPADYLGRLKTARPRPRRR